MSSRTRTHCPGCGNPYPPRARTCNLCGRARDQMSDSEVAAQFAPPKPVAPSTPMKMAEPPRASWAAAPFAAVSAQTQTQAATPSNPQPKTRWPFVCGGLLIVFLLFKMATLPTKPAPAPSPAPVAYVPSVQEKAATAKQSADDAKFWAEKEKREAAELAKPMPQQDEPMAILGHPGHDFTIPAPEPSASHEPMPDMTIRGDFSRHDDPDDDTEKSQHVSGYQTNNGRWVNGYNRRHP